MQKDEPPTEKPHAPTALERALRALSTAMRNLKQVEAPPRSQRRGEHGELGADVCHS